MSASSFFAGLVAGFLIGWIGLAWLTMTSRNHQTEESAWLGDNLTPPRPESG